MPKVTVNLPHKAPKGKGKSLKVAWNQSSAEHQVPSGSASVTVDVPDDTDFVLLFDGVRQAFAPGGRPLRPATPLFGIGPVQEIQTPAAEPPRRTTRTHEPIDGVFPPLDTSAKPTTTHLTREAE